MLSFAPLLVRGEVSSFMNSIEFTQQPTYRQNYALQYFDDTEDYVNDGSALQLYVNYQCEDIDAWNIKYPQYAINNVTITFQETHVVRQSGEDAMIIGTNETIILSSLPTPFHEKKHFFKLFHRDVAQVWIDTNFQFQNTTAADSPCSMTVDLSTWSCDACREYEYQQVERDISEKNVIDVYRSRIYSYISGLFAILIEIAYIIFWISGLSLFFGIIAFIIHLTYFAYKTFKRSN